MKNNHRTCFHIAFISIINLNDENNIHFIFSMIIFLTEFVVPEHA